MRLFIAIEVPEEVKGDIIRIQEKVDLNIAKIKLVGKDQIHLTLKFLGEVADDKLGVIKGKLRQIKFSPFKAKLTALGVFPNENYIKVIWVGFKDHEHINNLQKQIDSALSDLFSIDKRFHPHLTLGRVRFVKEKEKLVENIKGINVEEKEFEIKSFKLIKSTLTKQGPVYETLESFEGK